MLGLGLGFMRVVAGIAALQLKLIDGETFLPVTVVDIVFVELKMGV